MDNLDAGQVLGSLQVQIIEGCKGTFEKTVPWKTACSVRDTGLKFVRKRRQLSHLDRESRPAHPTWKLSRRKMLSTVIKKKIKMKNKNYNL